MARASYVYVAQQGDGAIRGTFTVKHEAQEWLQNPKYPERMNFTVSRFADGIVHGNVFHAWSAKVFVDSGTLWTSKIKELES